MRCYDCPRRCGAERERGELGFCGGGKHARIAKTVSQFDYEEPCLGTVSAVFFGGCSLKCSYCQNFKISSDCVGDEYSDAELAELFDRLGAPLDLVTPTHFSRAVSNAIATCKKPHNVIYNTSGYETSDGVDRACEYTDVFLTDFKYADEALAARLSAAPDYVRTALAALEKMRMIKDEYGRDGDARLLKRGLIVRHMVLPGQVQNSLRALELIAGAVGSDVILSLMSQFTPNGVGEPSARLRRIEYKIVCEHAMKLGFENGYFQDFDSADGKYTPDFDRK